MFFQNLLFDFFQFFQNENDFLHIFQIQTFHNVNLQELNEFLLMLKEFHQMKVFRLDYHLNNLKLIVSIFL